MAFSAVNSTRLFGLLLFALLILKSGLNLFISQYDIDGGYYAEVAGHVRDGRGLVTRVSLYHKGYEDFPHPTIIYPLWPQLLGHVARVVPMEHSAVWLPTLLYTITLVLGYLWANRTFPGPVAQCFPEIRAGHLFALLLGVNLSFFYITSVPYTEGLAFTLLLGFFLRASTLLKSPGILAGAETGIWLGVLLLTRSQWAVVILAAGLTLVWALWHSETKSGYLKMLAATASAFSAVFFPYWMEASNRLVDDSFWHYLRFGTARPNDLLSLSAAGNEGPGLWSSVIERLHGVLVAFNPLNPKSYIPSFFLFIYAVPAALIVGLATSWNQRSHPPLSWRRTMDFLAQTRGHSWLLVGLFSMFSLILVHVLKSNHTEWYFPRRHAIPIVFPVFFSLLFLLRAPNEWARRVGLVILVSGTLTSLGGIWLRWDGVRTPDPMEAERKKLITWLQTTRDERGELTVAINGHEAQRLAWRTEKINYHWVGARTRLEQLRVMHEVLGVDYLILKDPPDSFPPQGRFPTKEDKSAFLSAYRKVVSPAAGFDIYVWRGEPDARSSELGPGTGRHRDT